MDLIDSPPSAVHRAPGAQATLSAARAIVEDVIWATATTVGPEGAPRSRLVHPVWRWEGNVPLGLVTGRPTTLRVAHIAAHPQMSFFYWSPKHDTVAIDATASWVPASDLPAVWEE